MDTNSYTVRVLFGTGTIKRLRGFPHFGPAREVALALVDGQKVFASQVWKGDAMLAQFLPNEVEDIISDVFAFEACSRN